MKPFFWDSIDPDTGLPYTWDQPNLNWDGILEPGAGSAMCRRRQSGAAVVNPSLPRPPAGRRSRTRRPPRRRAAARWRPHPHLRALKDLREAPGYLESIGTDLGLISAETATQESHHMNTLDQTLAIGLFDDYAEINGEKFRFFPPIEKIFAHFGPSEVRRNEGDYAWGWPSLGLSASSKDPRYVQKIQISMALVPWDIERGWVVFKGDLAVGNLPCYQGQSGDSFCSALMRNKAGLPLVPTDYTDGLVGYKTDTDPGKHSICGIKFFRSPMEKPHDMISFIAYHFANPSLPPPPQNTEPMNGPREASYGRPKKNRFFDGMVERPGHYVTDFTFWIFKKLLILLVALLAAWLIFHVWLR